MLCVVLVDVSQPLQKVLGMNFRTDLNLLWFILCGVHDKGVVRKGVEVRREDLGGDG